MFGGNCEMNFMISTVMHVMHAFNAMFSESSTFFFIGMKRNSSFREGSISIFEKKIQNARVPFYSRYFIVIQPIFFKVEENGIEEGEVA